MVKISILYPNQADSKFDFNYYESKHMQRSIKLLSSHPGYIGVSVEKGVSGGAPNSSPTYIAMCHFTFKSAQDFTEAFMPHATELQADIKNYTNVQAVMQISEVAISESKA